MNSESKAVLVEVFAPGMEAALREIFYSSVREGCTNEYSLEQIAAWAPDDYDQTLWKERLLELRPFVAMRGNKAVGYADLQKCGYIDHFYVHGRHQNQGVGQALMKRILHEGKEKDRLYSHVSRTAKPFFERYGFVAVELRYVELRGVKMRNYLMERRQSFTGIEQAQ